MSAHDLLGGTSVAAVVSDPRRQGRRLLLKFIGGEHPELDRIEFQWSKESKLTYWQQGDGQQKNPMSWTKVPQALALIFLDYLAVYGKETLGPVFFCDAENGGLATSLGNAIGNKDGKLYELLAEQLPKSFPQARVRHVFGGKNIYGKEEGERRIAVRPEHLPPDCIEVFWKAYAPDQITNPEVFRLLAERIRKSLGIEASPRPVLPIGKGNLPSPSAPVSSSKPAATQAEPPPKPEAPKPSRPAIEPETKAVPRSQPSGKRETTPETVPQQETKRIYTPPPLPPIPSRFFEILNPDGLAWSDTAGLLDFGEDESGEDIWQLKDACEGVLILGAPGSGKTSGSGFAFAGSFLTAGFGGLVLAAKSDEAQRWQKLCTRFGRAEDCIVVTPESPYRLNILDYETQRPGNRLAMTDDLIAFFRVLIAIVSKRTADSGKDDFWTNATNQLMRELFDVFLLAGEPLTIESLTRFVAKAPEESTANWPSIPFFGEIILRAEARKKDEENQRIFERVRDYWTEVYPAIAHQTRSGIVLGFTAMANALSGRGIHSLISTETTLTPEMILSGKIVILDLPLKDCGQGGLLIQAAWKYLFQRAIERRADKGKTTARPVFLWEDEGHLFFSQHDIEFQPTARDCRAAHVIISQSLHNFYQLGHNQHAVQGVFATMNTHVFHANGDLETNKWASEKMGTTMQMLVNVSISSQPKHSTQPKHWLFDAFKQDTERESTSSTSINQHREKVFQPESFAQLKKGGDGSCQAVILWVSHQFKASKGRPFCVKVFGQDSNQ
jgi:hypothetical protein